MTLTPVVSWRRCTGCRACELACARLGRADGEAALAVATLGPWRLPGGRGLLEHLPVLDGRCHLCAPRRREGLPPACAAHCPTRCLAVLEGEEAAWAALDAEGSFPWLPLRDLPPRGGGGGGG